MHQSINHCPGHTSGFTRPFPDLPRTLLRFHKKDRTFSFSVSLLSFSKPPTNVCRLPPPPTSRSTSRQGRHHHRSSHLPTLPSTVSLRHSLTEKRSHSLSPKQSQPVAACLTRRSIVLRVPRCRCFETCLVNDAHHVQTSSQRPIAGKTG